MPVITNRPGVVGLEPDGPFEVLIVAGETTVPSDESWHVHRPQGMAGWMLHCNVAGSGRIRIGGSAHRTSPGEVMLFAPEAVHDYDRAPAAACWRHRWVYFRPRPHWQPWLRWPGSTAGIASRRLDRPAATACAEACAGIAAASRSEHPLRHDLAMNRLESLLIDLAAPLQAPRGRHGDERVLAACTWIDEHHREPLGVAAVAAHCGLSPSRLAHLFQAHLGMGVIRYRDEQRMLRARQLLRTTGMPVQAVADAVGYDDPLYFARVFRRLTGMSPSAFRQSSEAA